MTITLGYLIAGLLLVFVAVAGSSLQRLPLSTAMVYLLVGVVIGPLGLDLLDLDPLADAHVLERMTELAMVIALFTTGLKLRVPLGDRRWWLTLRLAVGAMLVSVAAVATIGVALMGMSVGLAVVLGAILAPTDPVLASDVQVRHVADRDRVRFSLTSEAGLNDGVAFPFLLLGLGLLGTYEIGEAGWRWVVADVLWAVPAGLAVGAALGTMVGRFVLYLRRHHEEAVGLDDFLALGLIALSYGAALAVDATAFLAVFAAGLAVRRVESSASGDTPPEDVRNVGLGGRAREEGTDTDPDTAPAYMAEAVLAFNEQIDRVGIVAIIVVVGSMLALDHLRGDALWFVPLLFFVVRPLAVWLMLARSGVSSTQRGLVAWFGVRGVSSLNYLAFAIAHGVSEGDAEQLAGLTLATIAASIVIHGISVTPLMARYEQRIARRAGRRADAVA